MRSNEIRSVAAQLKSKYGTSSPYILCEELNILISEKPMGKHTDSCKGFFMVNSRCKIAVINSELDEGIQNIVLAHELGHAVLHSGNDMKAFSEINILDESDRTELEANIFASELLIDDDELFKLFESGMDFYQSASILNVPPELLDFKLRQLKKEGHRVIPPYMAHGDFMKRNLTGKVII